MRERLNSGLMVRAVVWAQRRWRAMGQRRCFCGGVELGLFQHF